MPAPLVWWHFEVIFPVGAAFAAAANLAGLPQIINAEGAECHLSRSMVREMVPHLGGKWCVVVLYEFRWSVDAVFLPNASKLRNAIEDAILKAMPGLWEGMLDSGREALWRHGCYNAGGEEISERARALLDTRLSRRQRESLGTTGSFVVRGSAGGRYRIARERQINVTEVKSGVRWCYVTPEVPLEDQLLAQALLIRADEPYFRQVAAQYSPV